MATRYGWQTYKWLLERGWKAVPVEKSEEDVRFCVLAEEDPTFGDPNVIDEITQKETNIYIAVKLHYERTGEFPDFLPKQWF